MSTLVLPTQLQNAAIFVVFLLIIFFRPAGFSFGPHGREDVTMQGSRSLLPILVFTALYAALSLSVTNSYYQLVLTLVSGPGRCSGCRGTCSAATPD